MDVSGAGYCCLLLIPLNSARILINSFFTNCPTTQLACALCVLPGRRMTYTSTLTVSSPPLGMLGPLIRRWGLQSQMPLPPCVSPFLPIRQGTGEPEASTQPAYSLLPAWPGASLYVLYFGFRLRLVCCPLIRVCPSLSISVSSSTAPRSPNLLWMPWVDFWESGLILPMLSLGCLIGHLELIISKTRTTVSSPTWCWPHPHPQCTFWARSASYFHFQFIFLGLRLAPNISHLSCLPSLK